MQSMLTTLLRAMGRWVGSRQGSAASANCAPQEEHVAQPGPHTALHAPACPSAAHSPELVVSRLLPAPHLVLLGIVLPQHRLAVHHEQQALDQWQGLGGARQDCRVDGLVKVLVEILQR